MKDTCKQAIFKERHKKSQKSKRSLRRVDQEKKRIGVFQHNTCHITWGAKSHISLRRGDQGKSRTGVFQNIYKHLVEYLEELWMFA